MTDRFVVRCVALGLVLVVVGAVVASVICALADKTLPDLVGDMAKVSLGALSALLVNTRNSDEPAPVNVVNEVADAIPVEAVPALKKPAAKAAPAKRRQP